MKKEDVLSNCFFKEVVIKGAIFDNGQVVIPMEYNYVSRAKKNLFVGTKGSVNGFRTYGIEATLEERDKPYGEYFNEQLKNKTLDTEVDFYTVDGQIHMNEKILACIACLNEDMILLLKEGYRWSIALIDYDNMTITDIEEFSNLEYIKSDYSNRRFVVLKNNKYSLIQFDFDSKLKNIFPLHNCEPVEFIDYYGLIIKNDDKYGFMTYDGNIVLTCIWDEILLHRQYIEVVKDGMKSVYMYNGELLSKEKIVK